MEMGNNKDDGEALKRDREVLKGKRDTLKW